MKSWHTLGSKVILENPWIKIYKDTVMLPSGKPGEYTYIENLPFVLVAGIGERGWLLVRQFRYPIQQTTIEFPAGGIEGSETPLAAAKREFLQETGCIAQHWAKAGILHESLSTNKTHGTVFVAEGLTDTHKNEMQEEGIDTCLSLTEDEINAQILAGKIVDAKTIASFFLVKQFLQNRKDV
ncbi:MAG TPA: NUDIX hydrolase [Candidatus Saccharimonadales bacterium]|jgi:ADP-ribose pyrophosphatase|nr:NUDIX hydrolase [Candidatus Saccharimonadales bacterium]